MKLSIEGCMRRSVYLAFVAGVSAVSMPAVAQDAKPPADDKEKAVTLEKVQVTGTLLKRSTTESASPVAVIDRVAIENSGAATLGQLIQEMPNIAGAATNPQVNNDGGAGESTVSLRGLGKDRTLLLVNGRRLVTQDVNSIPITMIERVEVLKDGASSTYGSDAIGGVVNFITRKKFKGAELQASYGEAERRDGALTQYRATFGSNNETSNVLVGLTYDKRESISSADREFSKAPFALYYGEKIVFGSSRTTTGFYQVPRSLAQSNGIDCPDSGATVNLTRRAGADGAQFSDFRCYVDDGAQNDTYNFQSSNLTVTPQQRYSAFMQANTKLVDNVDAFFEGIYNNTTSNFQIAPEPFDGRPEQANVVASRESIYNPFGLDISDVRLRLTAVGDRREQYDSTRFQFTTGLKGIIADRFNWEASYTRGTDKYNSEAFGELYTPGVQDAIGPSFFAADGTPTCGTPSAPIAGCVPLNLFGVPTADQFAALTPKVHDRSETKLEVYHAQIGGDIFALPAGQVGVAVGIERREESSDLQPDFLRVSGLISGGSSQPVKGNFEVDELFAELQVPFFKDLPGVKSLDLNLGVRYSDYSTFGKTTNGKVGMEYRPISDLLVRATYAEVFRSPSITNLFGGQNQSAESFVDPCNGYDGSGSANAARACKNVPTDGTFEQTDSQLQALVGGNPNVQPEEGNSFTTGFVYSPSWYEPISFTVDYWRFRLQNTIGTVGTQTRLDQCFANGLFCDSFTRNAQGEINSLTDLVGNVGSLETDGIDFGVSWRAPKSKYGRFRLALDGTYLIKYDNVRLAGDPTTLVENAGKFNEQSAGGDGNFPRVRLNTQVDWKLDNLSAGWQTRFIQSVRETPGDLGFDPTAPCVNNAQAGGAICSKRVESVLYHDLYASYNFKKWHTEISLGVDNATDELAPLIYSGFNGTTDVRTYDTIGRFYYGRIKLSF